MATKTAEPVPVPAPAPALSYWDLVVARLIEGLPVLTTYIFFASWPLWFLVQALFTTISYYALVSAVRELLKIRSQQQCLPRLKVTECIFLLWCYAVLAIRLRNGWEPTPVPTKTD